MKLWKIKKRMMQMGILIKYIYYKLYCTTKKENQGLWLISERGDDARDNAYVMFKYIRENYPNINIRYIIKKESSDYEKVSKLGETIEYGSKEHYISMIQAEMLISTHIMGYTPQMNLFIFLDKFKIFRLKGKKVFLQHGITKDKMSLKTKMDLLISGSKKEYEFLKKEYPEHRNAIKCTGFARYDNLISNPQKQILIMPTWRLYLENVKDITKERYFQSYNSLINNDELINFAKNNGFKIIFYPHYEMQKYLKYFKIKDKIVELADFAHYDVQKLLIESDILITDFSSVFFDFAYMKKNIIYYQFDEKEYRSGHYSKGYFDYRRDGFGDVLQEEEEVVKKIESIISNNCQNEQKYLERIEDTFVYSDQKNSERIFNEIMKINKESV